MRLPTLQSQAGLPTRGGVAAVAPVGDAALAEATQQAGEVATAFAVQLQERRTKLQQATDLLQADSSLHETAGRLLTDLQTDTDYRTMEARYPATFDREAQRLLKGIRDPEVRVQAEARALGLRTQVGNAVRSRAVTLQTSDAKAALEASLFTNRQAAARATPEGRERLLAEDFRTIDALVLGGALAPDEGVKRKLKQVDDVAETQALLAIDADPYRAERALSRAEGDFAVLEPEKRTRLVETAQRAQRALEAAEERLERTKARERLVAEERLEREVYLAGFAAGTPPPLSRFLGDLRSGALQGEAARRVSGWYESARKEPRTSNPDVLGRLEYRLVTDPTFSRADVDRAIYPDGITFADAARLVGELEKRKDFAGDPEFKMMMETIAFLKPSEFATDPKMRSVYSAAAIEIMQAWRAGRRDLKTALEIRDRAVLALRRPERAERILADVPSRYATPAEAFSAYQRSLEARRLGLPEELSDEEFNRIIEEFRRDAETAALSGKPAPAAPERAR